MSGTSVIFFAIALKNEEELHSLLDNFNRHMKTLSIVLIRRWTKLNYPPDVLSRTSGKSGV